MLKRLKDALNKPRQVNTGKTEEEQNVVVIVDYGMGNLWSVYNAFDSINADVFISGSPNAILAADRLVVPGVGSFQDAMEGLKDRGLVGPIKDFIDTGKPYLGICLGLQILFKQSEEGRGNGLGIFDGVVRRFIRTPDVKIPHMGWNTVAVKKESPAEVLFKEIDRSPYFYFVHSYYADPEDKDIALGKTEYGGDEFASMIVKDNIYATQFHPEKSQGVGQQVLRNFLRV